LGPRRAWHGTAADAQDRAQAQEWAAQVQDVTSAAVAVACADQGDTGDQPAHEAAAQGLQLTVGTRPAAEQGVVLLPRRGVMERRFGWAARFRRLAGDDERLPETLAGVHLLVFAILLRKRFVELMLQRAEHALAMNG
jgi:transposase